MSRPIRFIVTYYSSGGISIGSEVITDPVLEMVHTTIEIDGTEYDYAYVHDHYAEIQVLLENDRMEKLLEEIDD